MNAPLFDYFRRLLNVCMSAESRRCLIKRLRRLWSCHFSGTGGPAENSKQKEPLFFSFFWCAPSTNNVLLMNIEISTQPGVCLENSNGAISQVTWFKYVVFFLALVFARNVLFYLITSQGFSASCFVFHRVEQQIIKRVSSKSTIFKLYSWCIYKCFPVHRFGLFTSIPMLNLNWILHGNFYF